MVSNNGLTLEPPVIEPDWTLAQLQQCCPGVELTLFSHFGIGSRERSGFSGKEILADLLRRHLVFDAAKACARLTELAQEDWSHALTAGVLSARRRELVMVDARGRQEFELAHLEGARYLSGELVAQLKSPAESSPVVLVCNDGSQSPAAARLLRKQGLTAYHLWGGLVAWSLEMDPSFPILYPLQEAPGHWYLLADGRTLRYRYPAARSGFGWRKIERRFLESAECGRPVVQAFPQVEAVFVTPRSFAVRGQLSDLPGLVSKLTKSVLHAKDWNTLGEEGSEEVEGRLIDHVLAHEAPEVLANHKGTVVAESYSDRVLSLALGGGCAGCASAQVTTQRELAALLYRRVPLLDRIQGSE